MTHLADSATNFAVCVSEKRENFLNDPVNVAETAVTGKSTGDDASLEVLSAQFSKNSATLGGNADRFLAVFVAIKDDVATTEGSGMTSNLSISQMLAQLETKIANHRDRQAFHTKQEVHHREQAALHAAELETAVQSFEAFLAASATASEILERARAAAAPSTQQAEIDLVKPKLLSRMVARILESKAPDEAFGPSALTKEIHARWGAKLPKKLHPRTVSATLRRWAAIRRIHVVREGKAYHEALYAKQRPSEPKS